MSDHKVDEEFLVGGHHQPPGTREVETAIYTVELFGNRTYILTCL